MISLYPCANLECKYPTGHPEFIDQPGNTDIYKFYGFVKCRILPPYELYHPVLPYRYESKLLRGPRSHLKRPYIKTFMKIKQEASGWPAECDTEEKRRNYLQQ